MTLTPTPAATWEQPDTLVPWSKNPRHNDAAVDSVVASMERFGFGAPIVARLDDRMVIAGHTRLKAAKRLGLESVPVRFVDLSRPEAEALALADNRVSEIATWDDEALAEVLEGLAADGVDLDGLGWDEDDLDALIGTGPTPEVDGTDDTYTSNIKAPIYTAKGEKPPVAELFDAAKTVELIAAIDRADVPDEVAHFLRLAAERHTSFHFRNIAEFYCHATPEVQDLMERSGLVIIDFDKAIEYGFVRMTERLGELAEHEADDGGS